jgi:hypothetical protein
MISATPSEIKMAKNDDRYSISRQRTRKYNSAAIRKMYKDMEIVPITVKTIWIGGNILLTLADVIKCKDLYS